VLPATVLLPAQVKLRVSLFSASFVFFLGSTSDVEYSITVTGGFITSLMCEDISASNLLISSLNTRYSLFADCNSAASYLVSPNSYDSSKYCSLPERCINHVTIPKSDVAEFYISSTFDDNGNAQPQIVNVMCNVGPPDYTQLSALTSPVIDCQDAAAQMTLIPVCPSISCTGFFDSNYIAVAFNIIPFEVLGGHAVLDGVYCDGSNVPTVWDPLSSYPALQGDTCQSIADALKISTSSVCPST
jgi:hypothetical protein